MMWFLSKGGLILNFVGTILVALSIGSMPQAISYIDEKLGSIDVALVRSPGMFRLGLFLVAVGFLLQLFT